MVKRLKKTVFISSTYEDLIDYRSYIWEQLSDPDKELNLNIIGMEAFGARSEKPLDVCLKEVEMADIFIFIIAMNYGSIHSEKCRSYTELEYFRALELYKNDELNKAILVYLIDPDNAKIEPKYIDFQNHRLLENFKKCLNNNHHNNTFKNKGDLAIKIIEDLNVLYNKKGWFYNDSNDEKCFVTATTSSATVAQGDPIAIQGFCSCITKAVQLWIFSDTRFFCDFIYVKEIQSFFYDLREIISNKPEIGQYFIVIQHPGSNGTFDIIQTKKDNYSIIRSLYSNNEFKIRYDNSEELITAKEKLINLINEPETDDIYTKLTFLVEEPFLKINDIVPVKRGNLLHITGITNRILGYLFDIYVYKVQDSKIQLLGQDYLEVKVGKEAYNIIDFELKTKDLDIGDYIIEFSSYDMKERIEFKIY